MSYPIVTIGRPRHVWLYPVNIQTGPDTWYALTHAKWVDGNAEWEGHPLSKDQADWPQQIKRLVEGEQA